MEILSIMNGAADPEIREKIKKFALLKGFLTWTPKDSFRKHSGGCNEKPKILFWKAADGEKAASSYRRRQRTENRTL